MADYSTAEDVDLPVLEQAYGLEFSNLTPLDGGMANSSFIAETSQGRLVVTVLDNADFDIAQRLAGVTMHMAGQGIPTSRVVTALDSRPIVLCNGKPVLIKKWIPGRTHKIIPDDLIAGAAELLARIHDSSSVGLNVPVGTRRLTPELREVLKEFPNQEHADWVRARLVGLDRHFPPQDDPRRDQWTPVHGDFIGSNIVADDDSRLWAIDWETATIDDPDLDCGMSVMNMCVVDNRLDGARLALFVNGYEKFGRVLDPDRLRYGVEYASVIVAFHRYRRHHIRFPNPARRDYYRQMVDFVEQEFPSS